MAGCPTRVSRPLWALDMRELVAILIWLGLSICALGQTPDQPDLVELRQDITALRQLGATLDAESATEGLPGQSLALLGVVSRENFANDLIVLLNAARDMKTIPDGVRGAALLRQMFAEPGGKLPDFLPWSWKSIQPELCRAAGLPEERCISLICLLPALDAQAAAFCPPPVQLPAIAADVLPPPALPDDPAAFKQWLLALGQHMPTAPIAVQLMRQELPVDAQIVAAKGELQAIWPTLVDRTSTLVDIKAGDLEPIVRQIVTENARRLALAAQILTAAKAATDLPDDLRAYLDRPTLDQLASSAQALEQAYDDVLASADYGILLDSARNPALEAGHESLTALRRSIGAILPKLAADLNTLIETEALECPINEPQGFYELAKSTELPLTLALQAPVDITGEFTAELVLTMATPAPPVIQHKPEGSEIFEQVTIDEKFAECLAQQQLVIPLGISVSHLVAEGGAVRINASSETLVQASDVDRFAEGLGLWIEKVSGVQLPRTLIIGGVTGEFSQDFSSIALTIHLSVPIIGAPLTVKVDVVRDGTIVLQPSAAELVKAEDLAAAVNDWLATNTVEQAIGPLTASLRKASVARESLQAAGTWLSLTGSLRLGATELGEAEFHLVGDRQPRLELATELTALLRSGPLAGLTAQAEAAFKATIAGLDEGILDDIGKALLIEKVEVSAETQEINVTLVLSPLVMPGASGSIRYTGRLHSEGDFGVGEMVAGLANAALIDANWLQAALQRIAASAIVREAADLQSLAAGLEQGIAAALGLTTVDFTLRDDSRSFDLALGWDGGDVMIENVILRTEGPVFDLHEAELSSDEAERLGALLQEALIARINGLVGLDWKACGTPRVQTTSTGLAISMAVQTSLVGCLQLPAASFDGSDLQIDTSGVAEVIVPALVAKLMLLIPEDYREYATLIDPSLDQPIEAVAFKVAADVGIGVPLTGLVTVSLADLKISIKVDEDIGKALFGAALGAVADLLGDSISITPMVNEFGLSASAVLNLSYFSVGVKDMEITPRRISIPEVRVRLPAAMAIGPFTVFPIEIRARVRDPMMITLIGDVSFAGLNAIIKLRGSFGMDIPPTILNIGAKLIMLEALELFESTGTIGIVAGTADAKSRTTGVLAAILPMEQTLHLDKTRATMQGSGTLIAITIKGDGEITFRDNPSIALSGSASAGGLADLAMQLHSDLELSDPQLTVSGGVDFLLGEISFDAAASRRSVLLSASVVGIEASLRLPSADDLNASLIEELFAFLLKPSIDLESLKSLKISVSPRVGGGDGSGLDGKDDGGGDKGGGADVGGGENTAQANETNQPVENPPGFLLSGTVPSQWQSGFRPAPADADLFCDARWRSLDDIQWTGSLQYPVGVAKLMANPAKPFISWPHPGATVQYVAECDSPTYRADAEAWLFFDDTAEPKRWVQGTKTLEPLPWVDAALRLADGETRGAAQVSARSMPSEMAQALIALLATENLPVDAARKIVTDEQTFLLVTSGDGAPVHLIGDWRSRTFAVEDPIRDILVQISATPDAFGDLSNSLLPELFVGWHQGQTLALFDDGRLLYANPYHWVSAFRVPPGSGTFGCGSRIPASDMLPANDRVLYDAISRRMTETVGKTCTDSNRWTDMFGVVSDTGLERVVAYRDVEGEDWSVDFVDAKATTPGCLRTGLTGAELSGLLAGWTSLDAITQDQATQLLGSDAGLSSILDAIAEPEMRWLEMGFPIDPFATAICEGQP